MKLGDAADECVDQSSVHRHAQHSQMKPGREVEFNEFYFYAQAALSLKLDNRHEKTSKSCYNVFAVTKTRRCIKR